MGYRRETVVLCDRCQRRLVRSIDLLTGFGEVGMDKPYHTRRFKQRHTFIERRSDAADAIETRSHSASLHVEAGNVVAYNARFSFALHPLDSLVLRS